MTQHWTEESIDDFVHRLSFDFITQLAKRLEGSPSTRADLGAKLGVSKGRISQILNNPGNLTLKRAVSYARALGMKVSVLAYDDSDPDNERGPISSEIFTACWEKVGRPSEITATASDEQPFAQATFRTVTISTWHGGLSVVAEPIDPPVAVQTLPSRKPFVSRVSTASTIAADFKQENTCQKHAIQ